MKFVQMTDPMISDLVKPRCVGTVTIWCRRLKDVQAHVEHAHPMSSASVRNGCLHFVEELRQAIGIIGRKGSGFAFVREDCNVDQLRAVGLGANLRAV